jgi:hypothetical protein
MERACQEGAVLGKALLTGERDNHGKPWALGDKGDEGKAAPGSPACGCSRKPEGKEMFVGIDAQLCHAEGAALDHLARCPAATQMDTHPPHSPGSWSSPQDGCHPHSLLSAWISSCRSSLWGKRQGPFGQAGWVLELRRAGFSGRV